MRNDIWRLSFWWTLLVYIKINNNLGHSTNILLTIQVSVIWPTWIFDSSFFALICYPTQNLTNPSQPERTNIISWINPRQLHVRLGIKITQHVHQYVGDKLLWIIINAVALGYKLSQTRCLHCWTCSQILQDGVLLKALLPRSSQTQDWIEFLQDIFRINFKYLGDRVCH